MMPSKVGFEKSPAALFHQGSLYWDPIPFEFYSKRFTSPPR